MNSFFWALPLVGALGVIAKEQERLKNMDVVLLFVFIYMTCFNGIPEV